jgi:holo-[acyl-carrier protein] synthase
VAGRFAGKEAVSKALGTGIGTVHWQEIEILTDDQQMPFYTCTAMQLLWQNL